MLLALLLIAILLALAGFVRNDGAEYRAFKALTDTEARQRAFRRWTLRSFLFFGLGAVAVLLLLGRTEALWTLPPEFAGLASNISERLSEEGGGDLSKGLLAGVCIALLAGGIAGGLLATLRRKGRREVQLKVGDIEPIFPRSRRERRWTALLAANAGPSEELFFRLMLPLLATLVTGDAILAFAASALIFGAVHFYQGWAGILGTTLAGALFTGLYLATGSIWVPVVLHSLMNLNTLWLRPWLGEWKGRGR
jgi:membrane protease YdiL (CAAX protease family)